MNDSVTQNCFVSYLGTTGSSNSDGTAAESTIVDKNKSKISLLCKKLSFEIKYLLISYHLMNDSVTQNCFVSYLGTTGSSNSDGTITDEPYYMRTTTESPIIDRSKLEYIHNISICFIRQENDTDCQPIFN
ncbi:unnamed protein product [Schistosoma mattheei]|uniref:Uncharacterized protein n=1 Tax=Schistosoma mattheei TaxID=31246 RepID=A0AA85AWE0_9TREM|nr:unnamed protein product [Schistosoma mattheei]